MKHLNRYLPLKSLDDMYKSLVRQQLEYCDFIYHIPLPVKSDPDESVLPTLLPHLDCDLEHCNFNYHLPAPNLLPGETDLPTLKGKVESIQYQAALAVTGG